MELIELESVNTVLHCLVKGRCMSKATANSRAGPWVFEGLLAHMASSSTVHIDMFFLINLRESFLASESFL